MDGVVRIVMCGQKPNNTPININSQSTLQIIYMKVWIPFVIALFVSCNHPIEMYLVKGETRIEYDPSYSFKRIVEYIDSVSCYEYKLEAYKPDQSIKDSRRILFVENCTTAQYCFKSIELPVYECDGFRKYGINLCDEDSITTQKLKDFVLNPKGREDYPNNPLKAVIKIVLEDDKDIDDLKYVLTDLLGKYEKFAIDKYNDIPIIVHLETIEEDTTFFRLPKPEE